jgi:hypothetical protein
MKTSISRFTLLLLAGLAVLTAGCSATVSASGGVTVSTAPRSGGVAAGPVSAAPPGPGSAPMCTTAQLALRIGGGLVSGGTDIYYLYFTNTSGTGCVLRGYPAVSAVTGPDDTAGQVGSGAQPAAIWPAAPLLLKPGTRVQATLRFARTGNFASAQCHHVNVLFLKIFPPGDNTAAYAGIDEQTCDQTTLPTMTITTVIPDRA